MSIDIWCQLPLRCPQKLGFGFEEVGPEDGREMVTITDTRRDSGVTRAWVWESTGSFPSIVTSSAPRLTPFRKRQNEALCDMAGPCPHVVKKKCCENLGAGGGGRVTIEQPSPANHL